MRLQKLILLWAFIRARYLLRFKNRRQLAAYQKKKIEKYFREIVPGFPYYAQRFTELRQCPILQKKEYVKCFKEFNKYGIERQAALDVALAAEESRDFLPELQGITIGLSSGTSGQRGIFLASPRERMIWAGTILGRALSRESLKQILCLWRPALRIAFFLRANSNLYTSVQSSRVQFQYFDITTGIDGLVVPLLAFQAHIIVAPASVLYALATTHLTKSIGLQSSEKNSKQSDHKPGPPVQTFPELKQIFSVAEVLELEQEQAISEYFGLRVDQIYQCTEGFLGTTCRAGNLHLNEEFIFFEKEWLDDLRFYPVLTDFTRQSQAYIRYRLDDILQIEPAPCNCGSASLRLRAIEGRADQVLWFESIVDHKPRAVYPDAVRRYMYLIEDQLYDYRITQNDTGLSVQLNSDQNLEAKVRRVIQDMLKVLEMKCPPIYFKSWQAFPSNQKQIRILCRLSSIPGMYQKAVINPDSDNLNRSQIDLPGQGRPA